MNSRLLPPDGLGAHKAHSEPPSIRHNTRESAPDLIKGFAALCVVAIHCSSALNQESGHSIIVSIAMLGVPLFVIVWGYNVDRSWRDDMPFHKWLLRLYARMLPPFIFWSLFYQIITSDQKNSTMLEIITRHWIGYGWSGQYYFILIFLLAPFVWIFRDLAKKPSNFLIIFFATFVLYLMISFHNYSPSGIYSQRTLPYYWLGYLTLGFLISKRKILISRWWCIFIFIVPLTCIFDHNYKFILMPYFTIPILLSSALISASYLGRPIANSPLSAILAWVGRSSLAVFVLNPLAIIVLRAALQGSDISIHTSLQPFAILAASVAIVSLSVLAERFFVALRLSRLVR